MTPLCQRPVRSSSTGAWRTCWSYAAYWQLDKGSIDRAITARGRADKVFWFPAWQAIYASDAERTLDFTGAESFSALTRRAYERLGVTLIDMPRTDAATRAALIRDIIGV
ncbi:AAA family ATPase [Hyphomonas sp.]|jgi:predicted ATPase|uniref:AAA family ATPase n=1 Tax=Hyphomonas sp. TaxID=87 RepID=UPI0039E610DA